MGWLDGFQKLIDENLSGKGPISSASGKDFSPSVTSAKLHAPTKEELTRAEAEKDAISGPTIGPISIDPTDYLTPGGLAKIGAGIAKGLGSVAGLGIIAGGKATAPLFGTHEIAKKITKMHKEGISDNLIARESSRMLDEIGNPGGAKSMFIGPDGKTRIVLSNEYARLVNDNIEHKIKNKRTGKISTKTESLFEDLGDQTRINVKGAEPRLLSDVLLHPSLYEVSDKTKTATVDYSLWMDVLNRGGMGASDNGSKVLIGSSTVAPAKKSADQLGYTLEGFLHEANHIVQLEHGLRTGTSNTIPALRKALAEAKELGSFKSDARLQAYETILDRMDLPQYKDANGNINARGQKILDTMYRKNYGEAEARAGSEYAPTTFPLNYIKDTW